MLMKKGTTLLMALGLMMATTVSAQAETVTDYVVGFDDAISTSDHNFKVAEGWRHIVEDNNGVYVTYSYNSTGGVDDSGCLQVYKQAVAEDSYSAPKLLYDLLVTPKVSGNVTIKVKQYGSSGYIEFYKMNDDYTRGDIINKKYNDYTSSPVQLNTSDFQTITLNFDEPTIIGIHASEVYIDDFTADQADVVPVKSMSIVSAKSHCSAGTDNLETTGSIYWKQDPDHDMKIKVCYMVTVTNTSSVKLTQGDENYSISIVHTKKGVTTVYGTTPVPQDLEPGATSDPFEVTAYITPDDVWSSKSAWETIDVREDLEKSILKRAQSQYKVYEHVLIFRNAGSYSKTQYSSPIAINFGVISEASTQEFEIFNDGAAPLVISEITADQPFTVTTGETLTVNNNETLAVNITFPADATGTHSGNLSMTYTDNDGSSKTIVLATMQGSMIGANTWSTTFEQSGVSGIAWPEGSVAESSVASGSQYINGGYNYFAQCTSSTSTTNKFITPLLHANAGEILNFTVKSYSYSTNGVVNVYVTKNRSEKGEPATTVTSTSSSSWTPGSVTIEDDGDYYIIFELNNACLDDIVGLTQVEVPFDVYFTEVSSANTYQSGQALNREVKFLPLKNATADDYSIQLILDDPGSDNDLVFEVPSVALTANSKSTKSISTKITPIVDHTVVFNVYWKFTSTAGVEFISPSANLTVQCEPKFCFVTKGTSDNDWNAPSSIKTHSFGKVNENNATADYEIFNWGKGELTINSVTMPEGFSTTFTAPIAIAGKERADFPIIFSATELGNYSGTIVINYVDANGENQDHEVTVSGTLLDTSKYYAPFSTEFPAGSVSDSNVKNDYDYATPRNYYLSCNYTSNNMFITPMLHAEANEAFIFDAKGYNTSTSYVKVYTSTTRQGLRNDDTRTLVAEITASAEDNATKLTTDYKTFTATVAEAGDYYLGFEIYGYVDDIYGLSLVDVAHDIELASFSAPISTMQNNVATATVQLRNFGFADEAAGSYSAVVSVNGSETEVTDLPEIPVMFKSNDTPVSISVPFRYGKVGTFPVSVKLQFGDYTVETEPADVEFTEEVLSADKTVGEFKEYNSYPFLSSWQSCEMIALYTPSMLDLMDGDVIENISLRGYYKGYTGSVHKSDVKISYAWVDETSLDKPTSSSNYECPFDLTDVINEVDYEWPQQAGSADNTVDLFTLNFNGTTYQEGKSLLLVITNYSSGWKNAAQTETSTSTENCWYHDNDGTKGVMTGSWGAKNLPVLHIALAVEPKSISGTVTGPDDQPVEGATITLTATDGSGVEYTGTTAADGTYEINVIQTNRTYNVVAEADGLEATAEGVTFEESVTQNFKLGVPVVHIHPEATGVKSAENVNVRFNMELTPGYHALALPFAVDADMVATLFGSDAEIYTLTGTELEDGVLMNYFDSTTSVAAGEPFLVNVTETIDEVVEGVTVVAEPKVGGAASAHVTFSADYKPTSAAGKFTFDDSGFVTIADAQSARFGRAMAQTEDIVPAFHATVQARPNQQIDSMNFAVDQTPTGINEISVKFPEGKAYDLRGMRSLNPAKGIYIINGKKVLVK